MSNHADVSEALVGRDVVVGSVSDESRRIARLRSIGESSVGRTSSFVVRRPATMVSRSARPAQAEQQHTYEAQASQSKRFLRQSWPMHWKASIVQDTHLNHAHVMMAGWFKLWSIISSSCCISYLMKPAQSVRFETVEPSAAMVSSLRRKQQTNPTVCCQVWSSIH